MKIIEDLKNNILKDHSNVSFDLIGWDDVLSTTSNITVYHLNSSVKYYVSYYEGYNFSFLIKENNKPTAIFPCFVHKTDKEWIISSNGLGLIEPLFISNTPKKLRKRLDEPRHLEKLIEKLAPKFYRSGKNYENHEKLKICNKPQN